MALNLQYIGDFYAFDGYRYDIRIRIEGGADAVKHITFGPEPIVIGTAREHEWMMPTRGGSGYLSIVCDQDTANKLIPTSPTTHVVEVHNQSGDVVWAGFIQQQAFTDDLLIGFETVKNFPIVDCVGVLEQLDYGSPLIRDIKTTIAGAFALTGLEGLMFYFPGDIARTGADNKEKFPDLCSQVTMLDTVEVGEAARSFPPNVYMMKTLRSATTAKEVIERVCRFFGWTCSTDGLNVYFRSTSSAAADKTMYGFTLDELSNGSDFLAATPVVVSDSVVLDGSYTVQPTSKNLDMEYTQPAGVIEIVADFKAGEDLIKPEFEVMSYPQIIDQGTCEAITQTDCVLEQLTAARTLIQQGLSDGLCTLSYDGNTPTGGQTGAPPLGKAYYPLDKAFLRVFDEFTKDELPNKSSFNWTASLNVCNRFKCYTQKVAWLTLVSESSFNFEAGTALTIVGRWKSYSGQKYSTSTQKVRFSVGGRYWDGRGHWVSSVDDFYLYVGDRENPNDTKYDGNILATDNVLSEYPNTNGYTMPIPSPMRGKIKLEFKINEWDDSISWTPGDINFTELRIIATSSAGSQISEPIYGGSVAAVTRYWELSEVNTYRRAAAGDKDRKSVELHFATRLDNDKWGSAFLYASDGTYLTTLPYNGGAARPEEHLLDRYVALYSQPTEWRTLSIRFEDYQGAFNAMRQRVYYGNMEWEGAQWSIEAAEVNWRDQTIRLDLAKLP